MARLPFFRPVPIVQAPLQGSTLFVGGALLALANFMVVLDTTIANVSVPNIAGALAVSPTQGTWVITSYSVAEAITVPLTGWLATRFGTVRVFCIAMAGFALFSALCGIAPSLGVLVAFRVGQGLCGGPMIPLSQALLLRVFPPEKAPMAIGLWAMTTVVAPVAGPILGGVISDNYHWSWIFFINVPVAVAVTILSWQTFRSRETPTQRRPVDFVGLGLLVLWVGSMQIMLDKGKELDWFGSPVIVSLAIVAVIGLAAFLIWELTAEDPIVDLRIFRHRGFTVGAVTLSLTFGAYFASIILIPLWLQTSMGYTATWAGYATAGGFLAIFFSPIAAQLVGKVDPRLLTSAGILWFAGVTFWRSGFTTEVDFLHIFLPAVVLGIGVPFFFVPTTRIALGAVEPRETASAAGLSNFMRTTAAAFAASITTTAWDNATTSARDNLAGTLNGVEAQIDALVAAGLSAEQALRQIDGFVQMQAVMLATDRIFLITSVVFLASAAFIWLAPRPRVAVAPGAAH
ncbi:DHA2 family efflux MFS transporter permease subunit [Polymorphobacter fuscus]|uniref:DHA2 family efflux MFS transporter permease subunit n=2 Tax=Sandarakinorhabdus fusca TaxID=1439888 RepID=A0A7C9GPH5_9SPHN|nr:DHA2 family efflux MFS transporter permease subunit [Polymorphobacter fuscus]MQT17555.1 DHA2 family efflux MFS transporter permease subunit [Polymorphobacter fuscus]